MSALPLQLFLLKLLLYWPSLWTSFYIPCFSPASLLAVLQGLARVDSQHDGATVKLEVTHLRERTLHFYDIWHVSWPADR